MPQAEHILEKVALNEVSALPWRWTDRSDDEWVAAFQIPDDSDAEHKLEVVFYRTRIRLPPEPGTEVTPELIKKIGIRFNVPTRLLTKTPPAQVGPTWVSFYLVAFYTDEEVDKHELPMKVSFAKIALRLFTTVAAVIRTFAKEKNPDVLTWKATTGSRASVYNRMMKREKLPGYVGWSGTEYGGYLRLDSPLAK